MPTSSKFVSKSFVRDEARAIRTEVIELVEKSLEEFKDTYELEKFPENTKLLMQLRDKFSAMSRSLDLHSSKLSTLVEGGIRSVIMLEKGERWVKSAAIKSAADVVAFVQQALNETTAWRDRAMAAMIDFLRLPGNVTRLVVLLSGIISNSREDRWSELRSLHSKNPFYKPVLVRISDGERVDWDPNAYNEGDYIIEDEPLWQGLVGSIRLSPFWLREMLLSLANLYRPLHSGLPHSKFRDYEEFAKRGASLACLMNLADFQYEASQCTTDFPPHMLEWDMQGSVHVSEDHELFLEGGEIKSSERSFGDGMWQLERRMRLLSLVLPIVVPGIKRMTAVGTVFAPLNKMGTDSDDTPSRRDQGRPGTRPSETIDTGDMTLTVHFRLLNEYY